MSAEKVKYKQKLSALDISALVKSLRKSVLGERLANIYDINKKNFYFKFSGEEKKMFYLELGVRFHQVDNNVKKN